MRPGARQFDSFPRATGLQRFLRFIERLRESEGDLGTARALGETLRMLSALCPSTRPSGLVTSRRLSSWTRKGFNKDDLRKDILFHRGFGLGAFYVDLENRVKYPPPSTRLSRQGLTGRTRPKKCGSCTALTRAKGKLVAVGSVRGVEAALQRWQRSDLKARDLSRLICPVASGGPRKTSLG